MSPDRQPTTPAPEQSQSLDQLRMLVPAYVLGALDASERALFERGLATPAIARVLQGEVDLHRASLAALKATTPVVAAAGTQATMSPSTEAPARPAVRVDTSAYREGERADGERPKRPTPMYGTAYRIDEWEPNDVPRASNRTYKPAKARRSRETERHADRSDRATPRSVRAQAPADLPRRSTAAPSASALPVSAPSVSAPPSPAPVPPAASVAGAPAAAPESDGIDLHSMEAAVDDLFSDNWSSAPDRTGARATDPVPEQRAHPSHVAPVGASTGAPDGATAAESIPAAPRQPVVRRGNASRKAKAPMRAPVQPVSSIPRETFDDTALDEIVEDAYEPRSRRGARGTPWAMVTLGVVALAAIAIAAWQGVRATRLQDRLLLQPTLDAVGSSVSSAGVPSAVDSAAATMAATEVDVAPAVAPAVVPVVSDDRLASLFDANTTLQVVQFAPSTPGGNVGAQLFWNVDRGTGVIHAFGLYPIAADRSYTLWMLQGGRPVSVTRFRPDEQGRALVPDIPMPSSRTNIASFAISMEPYGGSPRPTSVPILVGDLTGANKPITTR